MPRDAYIIFFEKYVSKTELFDFGIAETIMPKYEDASEEWKNLKSRINNNQVIYIRGFGREGNATSMFQGFYKNLINHENIKQDPTNNAEPAKLIRRLTKYSKTPTRGFEHILNYQVSHVFGRTKNIYAFMAPWNIVYIPKILDPFTGHEAKGDAIQEFQKLFQTKIFQTFEPLIRDYNKIMEQNDLKEKAQISLQKLKETGLYDEKQIKKFQNSIEYEFSSIRI